MGRITPRTCLWPVTFTILGTFALSIGLTFISDHYCYAGVCGEWLFPLQARIHVVVWYVWISISVTILGLRAFHPQMRRFLRRPLFERKLPLLGKHFAVSGLMIVGWVLLLYGVVTAVWWIRLRDYFEDRGVENGVTSGNYRLAAIALTGHYADITMGMVLLPISRHSALASFFKLSVSTTLAFHMLTAYMLFILVTIHLLLYVSWLPVFAALNENLRRVYPVLNPTYLYYETWPGNTSALGIWRVSLVFTGLFTTVILCIIFITTLPGIRRSHFNVFYFTHLLVILAVIVICLHASTMFYCTSPGLILWVLDWGMRLYELRTGIAGTVSTIGKGYYILTMKMPRNRLDGCACTSPLAHFYIYHSESSIRELHPFTTITHLASENSATPPEELDLTIQFLFRKRAKPISSADSSVVPQKGFVASMRTFMGPKSKGKAQWTEKLAGQADLDVESPLAPTQSRSPLAERSRQVSFNSLGPDHRFPIVDVSLRLEGPYFTPADPARYKTVICMVAGTGVSGAIAVANAFAEVERQRTGGKEGDCGGPEGGACRMASGQMAIWTRCVTLWTVREEDYIEMPFLREKPGSGLEVRTHLTGKGRPRLDFAATIASIVSESERRSTWVYLSGPNNFILSGELACKEAGVDWYGARWDV